MAPSLTVCDVRKKYSDREALKGVSLELIPGELVSLLGPNGAGKTTLIRAICGRHSIDSGTILVCGQKPGRRKCRAVLGFVPQELAIYPDLSVRQNLEVFGRLHGVPEYRLGERVADLLLWIHLDNRHGDMAGSLSGGMQRRLNIACGVMHEPAVLLLDEPTVGVDPQSRERIFEMLDELRARNTAILLTTHQLDEAQQRSDRIVIIDHGRIIAAGTLHELIDSTIGSAQRLNVEFEHTDALPDATPVAVDVNDVTADLPRILQEYQNEGRTVSHLTLKPPTLQAVFLHLTGRELRE